MEFKIGIFCCYARMDQMLLSQLKVHLMAMQRQRLITVWSDTDIDAGTPWAQEIEKHLDTAHIILLLVSADFIASDYCYSNEMLRAMQRHQRKEARVIPIILRTCDWTGTPFASLQALPVNAQPVTDRNSWPSEDKPLTEVTQGIRVIVDELRSKHILWEALKRYNDYYYEEALVLYDQVIQLDPHSTKAYRGKGDALYNLKRYEESLSLYETALQSDPSCIDADLSTRQAMHTFSLHATRRVYQPMILLSA